MSKVTQKYHYGQDGEGWYIVMGPEYPTRECFFMHKNGASNMAGFLNKFTANHSIPESRVAELAKHLRKQAKLFRLDDPKGRGAQALDEAATVLESRAQNPTHAEIAAAATGACLDRTGADGWIFANTDQLQRFLDNLKK